MRKVWKYPVQAQDRFTVSMPTGAHVLSVQNQGVDGVMMWALVDPDAEKEDRHFRLAGTGHPIDGDASFIGTVQIYGGDLVFHLFEEAQP